jgi:hypothetical protein
LSHSRREEKNIKRVNKKRTESIVSGEEVMDGVEDERRRHAGTRANPYTADTAQQSKRRKLGPDTPSKVDTSISPHLKVTKTKVTTEKNGTSRPYAHFYPAKPEVYAGLQLAHGANSIVTAVPGTETSDSKSVLRKAPALSDRPNTIIPRTIALATVLESRCDISHQDEAESYPLRRPGIRSSTFSAVMRIIASLPRPTFTPTSRHPKPEQRPPVWAEVGCVKSR